MGVDEVADLDVVAHAGAVAGRVILAENVHARIDAERRLHAALDQMRRVRRRLAESSLRVGAGDVEIAQRDIAEVVGAARVLEHPLDHQLGAAVRRDRPERGSFPTGSADVSP